MNGFLKSDASRPARYLLSGGVAWLVDLGVFTLCLPIGGIAVAQFAARTVGAVVAFVGHKVFVFRAHEFRPRLVMRQSLHFAALWLFSYVSSTLALIGLIDLMEWNVVVSKVVVEAGIILVNYTVMKSLIFRRSEAKGDTA
ncbi:MAG: GtrA family protein [Xanthomonadales bacterium]